MMYLSFCAAAAITGIMPPLLNVVLGFFADLFPFQVDLDSFFAFLNSPF